MDYEKSELIIFSEFLEERVILPLALLTKIITTEDFKNERISNSIKDIISDCHEISEHLKMLDNLI